MGTALGARVTVHAREQASVQADAQMNPVVEGNRLGWKRRSLATPEHAEHDETERAN